LTLKELAQDVNGEVNTGIISTINANHSEKKIPTEAQLSQISAAVNGSFLIDEIKTLYTALYLSDTSQSQVSYQQLNSKLQTIAQNFDLKVANGNNASELSQSMTSLIS